MYQGEKEKWKKFLQNNDLISSCLSCADLGIIYLFIYLTKSAKIFHPEILHSLQILVGKKGEINYGFGSN